MEQDLTSKDDPNHPAHHIGSRLLVASAFASVGAKLGTFGTFVDINKLLGADQSMGDKMRNMKDLLPKMRSEVSRLMDQGQSLSRASYSVFKWTTISTGIAMAAGFAIGWARGGLIADWKDILKHPVRSTKIILGLEPPPEPKEPPVAAVVSAPEPAVSPATATAKWSQKEPPRPSHAEAVLQEKAHESVASIG